jgi:AcrR family transcriptional regulator
VTNKRFDASKLKPHRSLRVLSAAEELITETAFAGFSLDAVVERAGCSKSTVYEYFGSKQGLVTALIEQVIAGFQEPFDDALDTRLPITEGLFNYARTVLQRVLSDRHIALLRAIVNEQGRSPDLAKTYYRIGPQAAIKQVAEYISVVGPENGMSFDDPIDAAEMFYSGIFSRVYERLFGAETQLKDAAIDKEASRIVRLFMQLYGD